MVTSRTYSFRAIATASILGAMVLLSGCATTGSEYAVLDRESQATDALPQGFELDVDSEVTADLTTARHVGDHEGTSLWVMRGEARTDVCLLAYVVDDWILGCGGEAGPTTVNGDAGHFTVLPDGSDIPENAIRISENIFTY